MTKIVSNPQLQTRLLAVLFTLLVIFGTLALLAYSVSGAFRSMETAANQIDATRAVSATQGALHALQRQLSATVRDNAFWDEAFKKTGEENGGQWALDNWGSTTAEYPLYDTAIVMQPNGKPLMSYHAGEPLPDPSTFYDPTFADLLKAARNPDSARTRLPVAFIRTREGIALIGAAAIQPYENDPKADYASYKVLIFSKQLTTKVLAEISENFSIRKLSLGDSYQSDQLRAGLKDINGKDIAYFTWPPERPGSLSYARVQGTLLGAGTLLVLLLAGIAAVGLAALQGLRTAERVANHRATHDALTGLLNRLGLMEQLQAQLATPDEERQVSLHLLDLDGFKPVNDAWGHAVGDELIAAVARRLVQGLPMGCTVARLGGDEFAIISSIDRHSSLADAVPQHIQRTLAKPFILGGRTIEIGGSVGTAARLAGGMDGGEMLRRADLALYRAKERGRGICVDFDPLLDDDAARHAELEQELRKGLAQGDLKVVFQPLIDAVSREVSSVEALARWSSPSRGAVAPDIFIGIAEKAGLIDQLGFQVLETAVREGNRWPGIGVAVNISPLQLRNPYFVGQVQDVLKRADFDPKRLTIEVTEGVLISNPDQAKRAFDALRKLGVKIALDDFGCGYASIGALREFGFDGMKIDRSLVVALDHDDSAGAILQATIALANALHLPVTAEGIETEEQAMAVRLSGCNKLQGYLFSRPISAEEITSRYFAPPSAMLPKAS